MTYIPPFNGGRINATLAGNSTSAGAGYALVSTGTMTLAGGNNITLSQNGNAVTFVGAAVAAGSNTFGMSNLGNTSGTTGVVNGSGLQMLLAGGNNITLSQSTNASSATITISAASQTNQTFGMYAVGNTTGQSSSTTRDARSVSYSGLGAASVGFSNSVMQFSVPTQTVQTQNLHNLTLAGNSTSAGAGYIQISSGTLTLAGGNNITLSQNGNAVTISAPNLGGGGGIALANSQTTYTSGTANMVVAGGAMTIASTTGQSYNFSVPQTSSLSATGIVSISTNASTISIGAPAFSAGISNIGNTAGTSGTASNQVVFAGGNNITLSQSTGAGGNTISISAGAGGGAFSAGMSNIGNTSGTSGTVSNQLVFAGGNNITLSQSTGAGGNTITISGGAGGNTTFASMWFPYNEAQNVIGQQGQGSLGFTPVPTPAVGDEVQIDRVVYPLHFSNSSNSTGTLTASFWMGLYTRTISSISLALSISTSVSLAYAGNNSSASQRGIRLLSFGWTTTIPDNRYFVGIVSSSATAGNNASLSQVQISQMASNLSGMWNAATNATIQWPLGVGFYSAATAGLPASVAFSQIQGTNSLAARPPSWHMLNGTA
jgi:hypothetical protein